MVLEEPRVKVTELCVQYSDFVRSIWKPWGERIYHCGINEVDFEIFRGDIVGLIGRNGSGKSTLLKAISGLIRPSTGSIVTRGRVILLAGTNPGFDPSLSGLNNVKILASAYGIKDENLSTFAKSVIEFASLGEAIYRPFKGYSSGMKAKLGFGFITALEPDVLLIDETLGVGDMEFRERAKERVRDFIEKSGCVIISTHSIGLARELCNRGLVLESGKIVSDEKIEEAMLAYRKVLKGE